MGHRRKQANCKGSNKFTSQRMYISVPFDAKTEPVDAKGRIQSVQKGASVLTVKTPSLTGRRE